MYNMGKALKSLKYFILFQKMLGPMSLCQKDHVIHLLLLYNKDGIMTERSRSEHA